MVLRLNLKGRSKEQFSLISSLIQSSVTLKSLQQNIKWGWDSSCSMHLGCRILGVLPILCIGGFKRREKWIRLYQMEYKYIYIFNHLHPVPKCMSYHKAIVVITGRAHCFHDCTYTLRPSSFCKISVLCVLWITSDHLYEYINCMNIYTHIHTHIYIYIYIHI